MKPRKLTPSGKNGSRLDSAVAWKDSVKFLRFHHFFANPTALTHKLGSEFRVPERIPVSKGRGKISALGELSPLRTRRLPCADFRMIAAN